MPKFIITDAPFDLIAQGIPLGVRDDGREVVEISSIAFVYKCEQTRKSRTQAEGPLPPS